MLHSGTATAVVYGKSPERMLSTVLHQDTLVLIAAVHRALPSAAVPPESL